MSFFSPIGGPRELPPPPAEAGPRPPPPVELGPDGQPLPRKRRRRRRRGRGGRGRPDFRPAEGGDRPAEGGASAGAPPALPPGDGDES